MLPVSPNMPPPSKPAFVVSAFPIPPNPPAVPPAIEDIPRIPKFAIPPATVLPILPKAPPMPGILVAKPPIPPSTPPNAVPTPGIKEAIGATFLTTFFSFFPIFLKKPYSGTPVSMLRLAIPEPAV